MWFAKKSTLHQQEEKFSTKASALIDRLNKPLPPIISSEKNAETLVIVVSGGPNVGKSTFIRFGLQNLIAKHDSNRPDFYMSRHIPTHVVGLKADLVSAARQIDPNLVQQTVGPFALDHFTVDAFSEDGLQQIQNVYRSILKVYHPVLVNNDKAAERKEEIKSSSLKSDSPGFIYAATSSTPATALEAAKTIEVSATLDSEADPDKEHAVNNHLASAFSSSSYRMVNKRATNSPYYTCLATKRGSKDSRKFMKPYELVKMLVERFENDGLASDASSPTDLQKRFVVLGQGHNKCVTKRKHVKLLWNDRIHSIFSLWLSHYWNDFYGPHARKHIILFLDRISKYDYLTPICDSLAPLVVREPPSDDADRSWGFVDNEDEEDADSLEDNNRLSWSSTRKRNEKKDSGYASGSFSVSSYLHHLPTSPSPLSSPTTNEQFLLKRLSNNNCTRINHQQEMPAISPNLNRLLRSPSYRKVVTHSESHPNLRSSYAIYNNNTSSGNSGPLLASNNDHDSTTYNLPRRAEFAGGLINIDLVAKPKNYYTTTPSFKNTPSIASTRNGAGWTLGTQLLASSFISSFRQHRSDKDQSSYDYKVFMKMTDANIADQLTWIEAELFCRIKPREFVRNIWHSSVQSDDSTFASSSSNNALSASVAHFNFISAWAVTMIVTQTRLSKRVAVLEKFMLIAVALRNHNNYNTLMAILAGINSASVLRLKQTRQAVCTKKVYKQFQSLERLMSTDRSFSSYRMALKATGAPGIPYLGIHNQDLVSLAEANKDFRADGTIHWEKFRLMGETIMATIKFKHPGYSIEPDSKILTLIADSNILSEDVKNNTSALS
ncbi:hypothetical protein [Parasitella parasitica]|uniref:Ras-GEF domain-containing protein n=1 Tax=Parasitella parasitica TaxID=35722 RepID=A0A0B7NBX0_9FUNG|nr:hypothetical protein [Parasitella parasitica]